MTDVFSSAKRSEVMSKIRGKGNKDTEIALIKIFKQFKISGWRRDQEIFGKPDFAFKKLKMVIFVDGCFWHSCPKHATHPVNNKEFWEKKLTATQNRDHLVTKVLKKQGWNVVRIWEHELSDPVKIVNKIEKAKKFSKRFPTI